MIRLLGSAGVTLAAVMGAGAGCSARNLLDVDAGPRQPDEDGAGDELLSDFEHDAIARLSSAGLPAPYGYWYSYNDMSETCVQEPPAGIRPAPGTPPTPGSGPSGNGALRATWTGCGIWGAGIGADLNQYAMADGAAAARLPYDLRVYKAVTFWAMAMPGTDAKLRLKMVMRAETQIRDGGTCDELVVGSGQCNDSWGQLFTLPPGGSWRQITALFSDTTKFKQEGWGQAFPWNPSDVLGIQIQSQGTEIDQPFDFWIDDVYLIR